MRLNEPYLKLLKIHQRRNTYRSMYIYKLLYYLNIKKKSFEMNFHHIYRHHSMNVMDATAK